MAGAVVTESPSSGSACCSSMIPESATLSTKNQPTDGRNEAIKPASEKSSEPAPPSSNTPARANAMSPPVPACSVPVDSSPALVSSLCRQDRSWAPSCDRPQRERDCLRNEYAPVPRERYRGKLPRNRDNLPHFGSVSEYGNPDELAGIEIPFPHPHAHLEFCQRAVSGDEEERKRGMNIRSLSYHSLSGRRPTDSSFVRSAARRFARELARSPSSEKTRRHRYCRPRPACLTKSFNDCLRRSRSAETKSRTASLFVFRTRPSQYSTAGSSHALTNSITSSTDSSWHSERWAGVSKSNSRSCHLN